MNEVFISNIILMKIVKKWKNDYVLIEYLSEPNTLFENKEQ